MIMAVRTNMSKDGPLKPWDWLGALEYEQMRRALIIFFAANGCGARADDLPDKVFQVAERKLRDPSFVSDYEGDPPPYLWTVARFVLKSERRMQKKEAEVREKSARDIRQALIPRRDASETAAVQTKERRARCLDRCMENIAETWRSLILEYYQAEGAEKKRIRQEMAHELGISLNALRVRVFKIRRTLRECMTSCLRERGISIPE